MGSDGEAWLTGREVTALAPDGTGWLALVDGADVVRVHEDEVDALGSLEGESGRCVLGAGDAVLVGTAHARLARVTHGSSELVASFDDAPGRDEWYTPWGGPPDTRSLSVASDGRVFANVHVGGILRAADPTGPWSPTIDIDSDVHQVLADPLDATHVVAATALGLAESRDGGDSWTFSTDGLHASYARAVALDGERLFLTASTGPRGGRAALYRREPGADGFDRCEDGLDDWFAGNIDSHRLGAAGGTVLFGTEDGRAFLSDDGGHAWREVLGRSARITCVGVAAA